MTDLLKLPVRDGGSAKKGPSMQVYKCARCGDPFEARTADRARGWARFCSKSCKAIKQEQRTGQFRALQEHDQRPWSDTPTFSNAHQFDNTELGDD